MLVPQGSYSLCLFCSAPGSLLFFYSTSRTTCLSSRCSCRCSPRSFIVFSHCCTTPYPACLTSDVSFSFMRASVIRFFGCLIGFPCQRHIYECRVKKHRKCQVQSILLIKNSVRTYIKTRFRNISILPELYVIGEPHSGTTYMGAYMYNLCH